MDLPRVELREIIVKAGPVSGPAKIAYLQGDIELKFIIVALSITIY